MQQESLSDRIAEAKSQVDYFLGIIKTTEWKKAIAKAIREYNLKNFTLQKVTPLRLKQIHSVIVNKFYVNKNYKVAQWNENQFKIFIWLAFTYGNAIKKHPFSFEEDEWWKLTRCFIGKSPEFCQFQLKALEKKSVHLSRWTKEEDELLLKLITQTKQTNSKKIKWMEISQQFYLASDKKFIRSAKVCREHWNTHLDPSILKCPWTFNEDLLLVKGIMQFGKKWAKVVEILEHKRTEHDVKNRFFSLCGKYIKVKQLERTKEDIEADQLYDWLRLLQQQVQSRKHRNQDEQVQHPDPSSQLLEAQDESLMPMARMQQKSNEFVQMLSGTNQSPAMLISPLPINFSSLVFSPMNIILRNDNDINYNLFSYESLRRN